MAIAATHGVTLTIEQWLEALNRLSVPGRRTVPHSNLRYLLIRQCDREWHRVQDRSETRTLDLTEAEVAVLEKVMKADAAG